MTPQRVSLVTLGTSDLDRARAFYAALGWTPVASPPSVAFYQMDGMGLGLFVSSVSMILPRTRVAPMPC